MAAGMKYHYIRNYNHDLSVNSSATAYRRAMHPIWHVLHILNEQHMLAPEQKALVDPMAEEELYDVEKDPYEIHNLATIPAYREVREDMKERLQPFLNSDLTTVVNNIPMEIS